MPAHYSSCTIDLLQCLMMGKKSKIPIREIPSSLNSGYSLQLLFFFFLCKKLTSLLETPLARGAHLGRACIKLWPV